MTLIKKISNNGLPLPGDLLIPDPLVKTIRSIIIHATPTEIWPWLVQMGQGRGGFYSYDWLENLFGMDIHNADQIMAEHQDLQTGDAIPFWKGAGIRVVDMQPECYLVLAGTLFNHGTQEKSTTPGGVWIFFLEPIDAHSTRLIVRSYVARFQPDWLSRLFALVLLKPSHLIMEGGMLIGIKERAERKPA